MGCPAIFLLGHRTKDVAPIPILLRSGDIVVMSGESRFCYHGVAGVLGFDEIGETNPFEVKSDESSESKGIGTEGEGTGTKGMIDSDAEADKNVREYLRSFRVNLNSRRVTLDDGRWLSKCGSGALAAAYSSGTSKSI